MPTEYYIILIGIRAFRWACPGSVDVAALDDERDPHVGAVLVEVLAADAGRNDVDRPDVSQRRLRRRQRLLRGVVGRRFRAADQLDDLHYSHASSSRRGWIVRQFYPLGGLRAAPTGRCAPGGAAEAPPLDSLAQRGGLPAADRRGRRRGRGGVGEELLEGGRDGHGLGGRGGGGRDLDARPGGPALAVRAHGGKIPRVQQVPVFDHDAVLAAVSPAEAIDRVRAAFVRHAEGEWVMPSKVYVDAPPHGDFRAMPARGEGLSVLKWVTSFPRNAERGLPAVAGALLASSAETGAMLAILDCGAATSLRTGAAAAVSAQALAREDAESVGVIGCGVNGAWAARC